PTCRCTPRRSSTEWLASSMSGPARLWPSKPQPNDLVPVLRRPLEPAAPKADIADWSDFEWLVGSAGRFNHHKIAHQNFCQFRAPKTPVTLADSNRIQDSSPIIPCAWASRSGLAKVSPKQARYRG